MKSCFKILLSTFILTLPGSFNTLAQEILPPAMHWDGASKKLIAGKKNKWITPCELSGLTETPDYNTTVNWLEKLTKASPYLTMVSIGKSEQGREIKMVMASKDKAFSAEDMAGSEKPLILIQAGIHAGEIDGKDAGMMLLRDITFGNKTDLLTGANLLFIPILNVDGHERKSKYGRVNQRGPAEMGWRTNAQNLNLNRDYTKMETAGIQAVINVMNRYAPHLYIDIHVTDGADYQYDITYGYMGSSGYSPKIAGWLARYFKPETDRALEKNGHSPGPLLFARNEKDFSEGTIDFSFSPRFSHAYGDIRRLPSILVENHSLKPYKQRVLGTYIFLAQSIRSAVKHFAELKEAIDADRRQTYDSLVIAYGFNEQARDTIKLLGIESIKKQSKTTGAEYVQWTGRPVTQNIPYIKMDKPEVSVKMPKAYWIPAAWGDVIEKIKAHGIAVDIIDEPKETEAELCFIGKYQLSDQPFEGRIRFKDVSLERRSGKVTYGPGAARISTAQPLGALAAMLLEPESPDSFFQWGYFHAVLSRTEYIESYVMEPLAEKMLMDDPDLKKRFDDLMKNDSSFASSPQKIYRWFYAQTPYFDRQWKLIPVGKEY